jgi:hypothetical protein
MSGPAMVVSLWDVDVRLLKIEELFLYVVMHVLFWQFWTISFILG